MYERGVEHRLSGFINAARAGISDAGIVAVADALKKNSTLTRISLYGRVEKYV
jgi:hypothetical protein